MTSRLYLVLAACLVAFSLGTESTARALDLERVLREVAASNPTLAEKRAMAEAAERRIAPEGAWPSPMLELGVVNVPTTGRFDVDEMTMKMAGISQQVPVFGSNRLRRRAAGQAASAAGASAEMTRYELFGMAWEAYANTYYAGRLAQQADEHQAEMDRLVESARARYDSGNGRLEDVLRAEAERARTRADLAAFRSEGRAARARLDALRGVNPGGEPDTLAPPPVPRVPADPTPWLAAVSAPHPRLRELDAEVSRYRLGARAARRAAWPDLELKYSYGQRDDLAPGVVGHGGVPLAGGEKQNDMVSASVGIVLPLFARQREHSEGAELDAMARASASERRTMELELLEQLVALHAEAQAAERTVGLLADTVVVTQRRAVDASWTAYSAGATDLWRVFESTHALYDDEVALTRARQELARAGARMLSISARGDLAGVSLPEPGRSER